MQRSLLKSGYRLIRILTKLKEKPDRVLILTHDYPDPDSIASAYALAHLLEKGFQIPSRIAYGGVVGRVENKAMTRLLKIPLHKLAQADFKQHKDICLVDTQPGFRNNSFPKNRKAFLVIDQHVANKKPFTEHAIIDTECGATCVILAEALLLLDLELPTPLATALAYGILTDTLNLYRGVKRKDVIQTYLALLPSCDMRILAQIQNPPRPEHFFETLAKGIGGAKVRGDLIFSHLGVVQNPDFIAQIADLLLTYQGMHYSLCTGRFKDRVHVSLRVEPGPLEATEILRDIFENRGEAGGHDTIAGGSFKAGGEGEEEELIQKLFKRLKILKEGEAVSPFHIEG